MFAWVLAGLVVRPAAAAPLVYTVDPSGSTITANLKATFDISVSATCFLIRCNLSGSGQVGGATGAPLASHPTGTTTADWGAPGWSDSITFSSLNLANPNPGSASGTVDLTFLNVLTLHFTGTVNISNISVGLGSTVTVPLDPSEAVPGAGPWTSTGTANLVLGATAGGSLMGTGLLSAITLTIPPVTFGGTGPGSPVTIDGSLSRLGSGSELVFDAIGASIAMGAGAPVTINVNQSKFGVTVKSVTMAITSLTLDDINAHVVATELTTPIPVPEPGTAALLGLGLLGITLRRRAGC